MQESILPWHKEFSARTFQFGVGLASLIAFSEVQSFGQSSSLSPQFMSAQQVQWVMGPATVPLGQVAAMDVPSGYRFVGPADARALLKTASTPGLLGFLVSDSKEWWATLEFVGTGYVKPSTTKWVDADAILKGLRSHLEDQNAVRASQRLMPILSLDWERTPDYDPTNHALTCAVRTTAGTESVIQQSLRLLGRNGVLVVNCGQKGQRPMDAMTLEELTRAIRFKSGQAYGDHEEGDSLASVDMYQLLTGEARDFAVTQKGWKGFFQDRKKMLWLVSILAACVFVLVIYIVTKDIRGNVHRRFHSADLKGRKPGRPAAQTQPAGRRRAYDYQKFYSDMMMQVSNRSYSGRYFSQGHETTEEDTVASASAPGASASTSGASKGGSSDELIARQNHLIEEQRLLLQQQNELIEVRSKLIEEKNQMLAKQSVMIENHIL